MFRLLFALLVLGAAQAALAADQFDLSCISAKRNKKTVPFPIKIDLARGEWCIGKCEAVFKIHSVTSSMIVLSETDERAQGGGQAGSRIDRVTGEYFFYEQRWTKIGYFDDWEQKGTCTPQPFTGFGTEKTKF